MVKFNPQDKAALAKLKKFLPGLAFDAATGSPVINLGRNNPHVKKAPVVDAQHAELFSSVAMLRREAAHSAMTSKLDAAAANLRRAFAK